MMNIHKFCPHLKSKAICIIYTGQTTLIRSQYIHHENHDAPQKLQYKYILPCTLLNMRAPNRCLEKKNRVT